MDHNCFHTTRVLGFFSTTVGKDPPMHWCCTAGISWIWAAFHDGTIPLLLFLLPAVSGCNNQWCDIGIKCRKWVQKSQSTSWHTVTKSATSDSSQKACLFQHEVGWVMGKKKGSWVGQHACSCRLECSSGNPDFKSNPRFGRSLMHSSMWQNQAARFYINLRHDENPW